MRSRRHSFFGALLLVTWSLAAHAFQLPRVFQVADGCSPSSPCTSGCCSTHGFCGFGPDFCGEDCVDTCDAVPECGEFAPEGKEFCPLNVCCSEWGFCGVDPVDEFCNDQCQSNCDAPSTPSCGETSGSSDAKTIGYWESWSYDRAGCEWSPEDIAAEHLTHINYAFALVGEDFRIAAMNSYDTELYPRVIALKEYFPALKVFIAVGGWAASGPPFSNMARTAAGRATFIQSAIDLMDSFGFDGIDLDWEYPVAEDRDGQPEDKENYVRLVRELKAALRGRKQITVAIPASYWYMQHFDLGGMAPHVDWFNVMTYDIHGTWDGNSEWTRAVVQPHTNLTEIDNGLDLIWRSGVGPGQVVLGLAFYGRSFALEDPSCTEPMCPFAGGAEPGYCMKTSGVLSNGEIQRVLEATNAVPTFDREAGVKYISWDGQWVSYDDAETLELKKRFANDRCLAGTMIWAIDLDPIDSPTLGDLDLSKSPFLNNPELPGGVFQALNAGVKIDKQNNAALSIILSECAEEPKCPTGYHSVGTAHGRWGLFLSGTAKCEQESGYRSRLQGWNRRAICLPDNVETRNCAWTGEPPFCGRGCPKGTVELAHNNGPDFSEPGDNEGAYLPEKCFLGFESAFCCEVVRMTDDAKFCHEYDLGSVLLSAGMSGAVRLSAVSQQIALRVAQAGGADLPDDDEHDNVIGSHAMCENLRRGFDKRSDDYGSMEMDWILKDVAVGRNGLIVNPVNDNDNIDLGRCRKTITKSYEEETMATSTMTCHGDRWPQACYNYKSAASVLWADDDIRAPCENCLFCPWEKRKNRHAPAKWVAQHDPWRKYVPGWDGKKPTCNVDEYPFLRFLGLPNHDPQRQLVRYIPERENQDAGKMIDAVCPKKRHTRTANSFEDNGGEVCTLHETKIARQIVGSMTFVEMPPAVDNHLSENRCTPEFDRPGANFRDVGFALFTHDPWYGGVLPPYNYKNEPPPDLRGLQKRREGLPDTFPLILIEPGSVVVEDRNVSRRATEEELLELGLVECESEGCVEEYAEAGLDKNGEPTLVNAPASCTSEISSLETGEVFYGTHNGSPGAEASPAGLSGVRGSPLTVMDTATAQASLPTGALP